MRLAERRPIQSAQEEISNNGFSLDLDPWVDEGREDVWLVMFSAITPEDILPYPSGVPGSAEVPPPGTCLDFAVVVDAESPQDSLGDWRRSQSCQD